MKPVLPPLLHEQGYTVDECGDLVNYGAYACVNANLAALDGRFSADELEAIVEWMRAHPEDDE